MTTARTAVGSFNSNAPISTAKAPECKGLFEKEQADLLADLYEMPGRSCDRKGESAWHVAAGRPAGQPSLRPQPALQWLRGVSLAR